MQRYDAIVLAGGTGRRLGRIDKAALDVGAGPLLEGALAAVVRADRIVVVGPARALPPNVIQVSEDPPGGGPVAAVAAGLTEVEASVVVVLACDMPFVSAAVVDRLARAAGGSPEADPPGPVDLFARQAGDQPDPDPARPGDLQTRSKGAQPDPDPARPGDLQTRSKGAQPDPDPARPADLQTRSEVDQPDPDASRPGDHPEGGAEPDAVMLVDANGKRQFLTAAYRTAPLREALGAMETDGASMRQVVRRLTVAELTADPEVTLDCDTWADVEHSRDLLEGR